MEWAKLSVILGCIQFIGLIVVFCVIKFNDFRHLGKDVEEIKLVQKEQQEKLNQLCTDVEILKTRLN